MSYSMINFEVRDHVPHLTLNQPEAANALNLELAFHLRHAARRCTKDASISAVLLSGAGKLFCAGGDAGVCGDGQAP